MNNFTFYSPTMFAFGQGEASRVGALVRQFGGSKVLLVAGGGSVKKNGAYDAVAASLKEAGLPCYRVILYRSLQISSPQRIPSAAAERMPPAQPPPSPQG